MSSMSMPNIMAGFRCTGIYPFSHHALAPIDDLKHTIAASLADRYGVNFIPMCGPSCPSVCSTGSQGGFSGISLQQPLASAQCGPPGGGHNQLSDLLVSGEPSKGYSIMVSTPPGSSRFGSNSDLIILCLVRKSVAYSK